MRPALALLLVPVVVRAGCGSGGGGRPRYDGTEIDPPSRAPGFSLRDQSGQLVSLASERGHYVIVTFLYTHCPDVCPVIAGNLDRALRTPVARRAGLRVLAIGVDPKGDTPAAVRAYVRSHRLVAAFRYLIGSTAKLRPVWRAYHVAALAGKDGTVAHTAIEFLVDPNGRERLAYGSNVRAAWVTHDLEALGA
jgi:protein SCO1